VIDGLDGKVARFLTPLGKLEILDPAILTSELGFWVDRRPAPGS